MRASIMLTLWGSRCWSPITTCRGETLPDAKRLLTPTCATAISHRNPSQAWGVAFYLMLALRTLLRDKGWFDSRGIAVPNLAEYLDLVALGTVADVVPLDTNNRILTWQGLSRIRAGKCRPGIKALLEIANRDPLKLAASDLGFALGPRLNAAGSWTICPSAWRCCCATTSVKRACWPTSWTR
ncbi:ssDNA exonuclease RecJ [Enterobacter asburiae]|uniref:SsDNA exonuclease RecJ n=1 Tax=Enterobacter asburiae TaxID=61645 RepID=A0A376FET8_ENTAS|nr:ssDNA exonuclease RecJ [Enterobacter asburiae]